MQRPLSVEMGHLFQEHYADYGTRVAFWPDHTYLAPCTESHTLLLGDVNRSRYLPWLPYERSQWGVDTVLDATLLAELTRTGRARIWPLERLRADERPWHDLFGTATSSLLLCWEPDCLVEVRFPKQERLPTFPPDGRFFVVALDGGRIGIYDPVSLQAIGSFATRVGAREDGREVHSSSSPTVAALSPDSTLVVIKDALRLEPLPEEYSRPCSVDSVHGWERGQPGSVMRRLGTVEGHLLGEAAFSPDNYLLALALNDCVQRYHARTFVPLASVNRSEDISRVAFSPDGRYLANGGWDGDRWIWDTLTGQLAAQVAAHPDCETCRATGQFQSRSDIAWSPDSKLIAPSGKENNGPRVRLWRVDEQ